MAVYNTSKQHLSGWPKCTECCQFTYMFCQWYNRCISDVLCQILCLVFCLFFVRNVPKYQCWCSFTVIQSLFYLVMFPSQKETEYLFLPKRSSVVFFFFFFHQCCCIHTDLSLEWTSPKLNPTVRLSCVFVKDAMYSSGNSRITIPKANMCPVIPSNDLGGLKSFSHASLPESSHNLSLLLIRTWVSFKPIFLSSEKNDT